MFPPSKLSSIWAPLFVLLYFKSTLCFYILVRSLLFQRRAFAGVTWSAQLSMQSLDVSVLGLGGERQNFCSLKLFKCSETSCNKLRIRFDNARSFDWIKQQLLSFSVLSRWSRWLVASLNLISSFIVFNKTSSSREIVMETSVNFASDCLWRGGWENLLKCFSIAFHLIYIQFWSSHKWNDETFHVTCSRNGEFLTYFSHRRSRI